MKSINHKSVFGYKMTDKMKSNTVVKLELKREMLQNMKTRKLCTFVHLTCGHILGLTGNSY